MVTFDDRQGVLCVSGEEDRVTSGRRRRPFSAAIKASADVIVDLSDLNFADASLMLDIAVLARRLRQQDRELRLRGAQPHIQRLIEMMGLHRLPAVALDAPLLT